MANNFFPWWKRHLNVYHLFARSENGLMVQMLSGLITYSLANYYHEQHGENDSIRYVRRLRTLIQNEALSRLKDNRLHEKKSVTGGQSVKNA